MFWAKYKLKRLLGLGHWARGGRVESCKTSLSRGVVFLEISGVLIGLQCRTAAPLQTVPLSSVVILVTDFIKL